MMPSRKRQPIHRFSAEDRRCAKRASAIIRVWRGRMEALRREVLGEVRDLRRAVEDLLQRLTPPVA